jgi:hypothetical protein
MSNFDANTITQAFRQRPEACADPQQKQAIGSQATHLRDFAHEVKYLHFRIRAEGHETSSTHIFRDPNPCLDTGVAFGVRASLSGCLEPHHHDTAPDGSNVPTPFVALHQDFILAPSR